MNKQSLILLSVILTFSSMLVLYNLRSSELRNKAIVSNLLITKEADLGNVHLNSKKEFGISLSNPTKKDFTVAKVYTSCGCTKVVGETAFIIKQGETVNVKVEFDPSSMHQKGDSINHEVYFLVTSPIEKEYKARITGKVI